MPPVTGPFAWFDGQWATDLQETVDLTADAGALDGSGWWAVAATFEGRVTGYRFGDVRRTPLPRPDRTWRGPTADSWRSSLGRADYLAGVRRIREHVAAGSVYQVNLCRVLDAPLDDDADPLALAAVLAAGNPAPYQGVLSVDVGFVVTASPELFLSRDGSTLVSSPVKGTAAPGEPFADKDTPENVMITDLVRNDLGRVAVPGSVVVQALLARQEHPGLAHLVSTVSARLEPGLGWTEVFAATLPPGSVSGAPKIRALQVISELEPVTRGQYCGAVGYVDADRRTARLAVGIRTFTATRDDTGARRLAFGTGAGITWSSDPAAEWAETELKAARLIGLASS